MAMKKDIKITEQHHTGKENKFERSVSEMKRKSEQSRFDALKICIKLYVRHTKKNTHKQTRRMKRKKKTKKQTTQKTFRKVPQGYVCKNNDLNRISLR